MNGGSLKATESTASVVRAAQNGDDLAFADLVRHYQDHSVAYARSIVGDHHLAEDAAQEAFVEAHRHLASLRNPAAFASWFRAIVFKHCDRMTRRKRHPSVHLDAAVQIPSSEPSPHDLMESQDVRAAIRTALARLSPAEREVVLLYYAGDHSHLAIAEFLDVTANAVKTRLYSARKKLKKYMEDIQRNLEASRPSTTPRFARRVIGAALPLQLFFIDEFGRKKTAGSTIASRSAETPDSETWLIEPRQVFSPKDWDTTLALIRDLRIPGLAAPRQITDSLLARICDLDHLTYLDLSNTEVTDAGLQSLARLPALRYLNLSTAGITDRGLDILRHLPRLQVLDLYHQPQVTDQGLSSIRACPDIERLNLMGTRTGDGVIEALAGKPRLGQLYAGNAITDAGLSLLRQIPKFKNWSEAQPAMSLMSDWAHPSYLWLNLTSRITDAGLANLEGLDGLYAVNLFGAATDETATTPAALTHVGNLPNLGWLGCCGSLCTNEAMRHIARMPKLRFLMCQDAVAGDDGFRGLSPSQSIEYIWGRRCYNLTARGFSALAAMPALRGLSVSCKNVDDAGLAALPHFPALREFMPMDVPDAGFRHVGECAALEALHCMYCPQMTDAATAHIAGLENLKTFQVWITQITDRSLETLGKMNSLERLRFYSCPAITGAGLAAIADLPRLGEVNLESLAQVTPDAAAIFPARVQVNYSA